jgi:hypothetical protein
LKFRHNAKVLFICAFLFADGSTLLQLELGALIDKNGTTIASFNPALLKSGEEVKTGTEARGK